jgi:hypothetical protein
MGGRLSTTFTVKEQPALFPSSSVAVHVTSVSPRGNSLPAGACRRGWDCVATVLDVDLVVHRGRAVLALEVMSGGHSMRGAGVPDRDAEAALNRGPSRIVVRHVTIVVPIGKTDPEGGLHEGVGGGLHVAVSMGGGYSTTAPPVRCTRP